MEQLGGLAHNRPVVYEDVHWADPSTLELLDLLVERVRTPPLVAVLTYRPDLTPTWSGCAHLDSFTLSRLGQRHGAQMIERLTGKPLPGKVLQRILAKTDGISPFVEQLTKTVLESCLLADASDRYGLAGPLPPPAIPAPLHDSLRARLDRLGPIWGFGSFVCPVVSAEDRARLEAIVADRNRAQKHVARARISPGRGRRVAARRHPQAGQSSLGQRARPPGGGADRHRAARRGDPLDRSGDGPAHGCLLRSIPRRGPGEGREATTQRSIGTPRGGSTGCPDRPPRSRGSRRRTRPARCPGRPSPRTGCHRA